MASHTHTHIPFFLIILCNTPKQYTSCRTAPGLSHTDQSKCCYCLHWEYDHACSGVVKFCWSFLKGTHLQVHHPWHHQSSHQQIRHCQAHHEVVGCGLQGAFPQHSQADQHVPKDDGQNQDAVAEGVVGVWVGQLRLCGAVCPTGNGVCCVRMAAGSGEEGHGAATAERKKEMTENQSSAIIVENSTPCGYWYDFILYLRMLLQANQRGLFFCSYTGRALLKDLFGLFCISLNLSQEKNARLHLLCACERWILPTNAAVWKVAMVLRCTKVTTQYKSAGQECSLKDNNLKWWERSNTVTQTY